MPSPKLIPGLWLATVAAVTALAQTAPGQPPAPVVLELFTSEGCSSCVSADALFAQIESGRTQWRAPGEVITLGEHVDYWDSQEWLDRFSSPLFSSRQQDYGRALHQQDVYTPMVVVNGQAQCVGSDFGCIQRAALEAARVPQAAVIIRPGQGPAVIAVGVQRLPPAANSADVLLAITESGVGSNILGGENRGRRAMHAAVVRSISQLSRIDPRKNGVSSSVYNANIQLNLNPQWNRRNVRLVVLVQDRTTRRILGAAATPACMAGSPGC